MLALACAKLYGDEAGPLVAKSLAPERLGIPGYKDDVSLLMPLATERLPGTRFSRFRFLRGSRVLRWRADIDENDVAVFRREIAIEKASVRKSRDAAVAFRTAAGLCVERQAALLRMADCCEVGAQLGELVVNWLELILRERDYLNGAGVLADFEPQLIRLEDAVCMWKKRFAAEAGKALDASGGNAHDGLLTAEYLEVEVQNMRNTLETAIYPDHPIRTWW